MLRRLGFTLAVTAGALGMQLTSGCVGTNGNGSTTSSPSDSSDTTRRASDAQRDFPLDSLPTATISIGEHELRVWLAQDFDDDRAGVVSEGLMHVPTEEIADDQGMLFVFSDERLRGFWMLNTIAPLDIAYARMDGTIVKIWQMPPLTLRTFPSIEPAMFALEVKQGTFERLNVQEGDIIAIPDSAFKINP